MSLGYLVLVLVVYTLAAARVTKLINSDTILDSVRLFIARRIRDENRSEAERTRWAKLDYWMGCPWCAGMWVAFTTTWAPVYAHANPIVRYITVALAVSMLIGLASRWSSDDAPEVEQQ